MVEAFESSGQSVSEFAAEHGVQYQRVHFWLKRLGRSRRSGRVGEQAGRLGFAPVRLIPKQRAAEGRGAGGIEIALRSGRTIRIGNGELDPHTLRRVVEVLEEVDAC